MKILKADDPSMVETEEHGKIPASELTDKVKLKVISYDKDKRRYVSGEFQVEISAKLSESL